MILFLCRFSMCIRNHFVFTATLLYQNLDVFIPHMSKLWMCLDIFNLIFASNRLAINISVTQLAAQH